jgi:hypothetical protein
MVLSFGVTLHWKRFPNLLVKGIEFTSAHRFNQLSLHPWSLLYVKALRHQAKVGLRGKHRAQFVFNEARQSISVESLLPETPLSSSIHVLSIINEEIT